MNDVEEMLHIIEHSNSEKDLRQWIENCRTKAPSLAKAAFKRLVLISPKEQVGTVEHDFWQTILAFELMLSEERGRKTLLSRTRQKLARVGVLQTLNDFATSKKPTDGFVMLIERGMPELTGEAIVLRHQNMFSAEAVEGAKVRLTSVGVELAAVS